jgi:PAS domain S-box-containing protein
MTGYSKDELTQMGLRDIHPEQDLPHVIEEFELSAKGEKNINPNIPVKRRDGGIFYADIRTTTLLLNGKEYLMGVFRDITERKQADEKLRKITESVFDAIVMIDQNGKINYWNTAAEAIFGYTKNEAMGKDVHTLLLPEDYAESYRDGMKTFKTNGTGNIISKRVILPARRKDGSQFYAEHSFASFQSDNDWNAVSVIRDYTEQKRYEDALKKLNETLERRVTERAKELNEMRWQLYHVQKLDSIGRLAGGVAHDFNNILMAIIGYASLAELGLAEGNPAREYIKKILESSNKATNLTQSLLAFSRRQPVSLESVNLKGIINDMEQLLFKTAGEKIDCRLMLSDQDLKAKDVNVMADRDKIEQVLMNLAMNAVDAMPAGGTLTISTDIVMLDSNSVKRYGLDKEGAYGVITVSDTGIGMNEETKSKIFEPFFTTKERGKGTGIGLSIAYGIIKQHNGHIEVISAPGKGTTFNIYLPITEREVMKRNTSDTHIPVSTGIRTILLAEDERDVREVVTKILERSGYRVISAINGDDAIKKFEENKDRVDMLVFDVMMPKMNGKEAYNIIKELNPGMKILFMSGHSEDNSINKEIREEGLLFIQKPVIPDKLFKKIKEAFVV